MAFFERLVSTFSSNVALFKLIIGNLLQLTVMLYFKLISRRRPQAQPFRDPKSLGSAGSSLPLQAEGRCLRTRRVRPHARRASSGQPLARGCGDGGSVDSFPRSPHTVCGVLVNKRSGSKTSQVRWVAQCIEKSVDVKGLWYEKRVH